MRIIEHNKFTMNKFMGLFRMKSLLEFRTVSTRITADGKEVPKTKNLENRITLIGADNSVSITDLKSAQNLSLKRELKLVKIQDVDSKTRRPVYKLMNNAEYHAEELARRKEKQAVRQNSFIKREKFLTFSSRIGEHDLMTGVKKMIKLLEKQYEIKVVVAGEGEGTAKIEQISDVVEKNIKAIGKMVQKRNKGNNLKFQLVPIKQNLSQDSNEKSSSGNESDHGPL
ncbi:translation initiation factor IF-3, mitochondrial [Manduca sexta]|uniref:Translation initiation factor IF-3, mitochondrial n=1 Tax=Manduca sexta TaxID=7130 RepID=A0A921ZJA4_MANSE|nr:translation initiation factor IF-3, mitochondrial [Manduca sexta]KAG6458516.1 hypothetical protein O3G_MSEX010906 [Manduca sexta]KAG6458517.1 hypothetical protein O3G_MSEX010906 [Manduca sexta]